MLEELTKLAYRLTNADLGAALEKSSQANKTQLIRLKTVLPSLDISIKHVRNSCGCCNAEEMLSLWEDQSRGLSSRLSTDDQVVQTHLNTSHPQISD